MATDRIVSLAPSNTEILYALGVADRIVATTALCDEPEEAQEKPSVGGWTTPDIAAVQAHDPDLVLASDALQDDAVERCRTAGMRVKQVTPTTLHGVCNSIKAVGEYVDREAEARELVDAVNDRVRELAVPDPGERVRVYCEEWHAPPMVAGNWVPYMVRLLGGAYMIDEGERSRETDLDELRAFDPEHIVLHYCGMGGDAAPEQVMQRDGWQQLTAVLVEQVHVIDDTLLNRPGPRIVDGMAAVKDALSNG